MSKVSFLLFCGVCCFLGSLTFAWLGQQRWPQAVAQGFQPGSPAPVSDLERLSERFESIVRRVSPTVVSIEAIKPASKPGAKKPIEDSGSGVVLRWPGQRGFLVLTNNHVVNQADPRQISVCLADNRILRPAQVLADPESDIAVLRLDVADAVTADLGDSDRVRVGNWVLAFGSPFGLNQTVTHGIISARERGQISLGSTIRIKDFLQTDAAINPGSSGGPLVDLDGRVIGINTAIASNSGSNSGVAFSVPINLARGVVQQLLDKGAVSRGYLGLQVGGPADANEAERLGLSRLQGALVERVYEQSPALAAGVKAGDVILEADQVVIRNENHFINLISGLPPGKRIRLQVWRQRQAITLEAVVGDWVQAQQAASRNPSP
jgi:S1-C subfamily serine protease